MSLVPSASQTLGPFFNFALTCNAGLGILAPEGVEGERIRLAFKVIDGDGAPAPGDAMIELWQADSRGRYLHSLDPRAAECDPNFHGFGRLETDVFADAQLAGLVIEQVAHRQSAFRVAQHQPGVIFIGRFHMARILKITRLHMRDTADVRSEAKLLPRGVLHPMNAIVRHSLTLVG